jgi:hypothetical protein
MGVMSQDRFGETLGDLVRELDPLPDVPSDEIWAGVAAARRFRRQPQKPRPWRALTWGFSLAATLAMGFLLGRLWSPAGVNPTSTAEPDGLPVVRVNNSAPRQFRLAAADYLARTEELLAEFPEGAEQGRAPEVASWARQLLLDTRLLIDSPAGADPEIKPLLTDLELVLAQIASLREGDDSQEIKLIVDGIEQNRVMARLRVVAGAAAGTNGDD